MNVTFHTLGSFATAALLSAKILPCRNCFFLRSDLPYLIVGFIAGVLLHGILDFTLHSYPFSIPFDIIFSLLLFVIFAALVRRLCSFGSATEFYFACCLLLRLFVSRPFRFKSGDAQQTNRF